MSIELLFSEDVSAGLLFVVSVLARGGLYCCPIEWRAYLAGKGHHGCEMPEQLVEL